MFTTWFRHLGSKILDLVTFVSSVQFVILCAPLLMNAGWFAIMSQVKSTSNSLPRPKRTTVKHDYANLSKKGMQSLKIGKTKSRVKSKMIKNGGLPATPGSANWRVELFAEYNEQEPDRGRVKDATTLDTMLRDQTEVTLQDNGAELALDSMKHGKCMVDLGCDTSTVTNGHVTLPPDSPLLHNANDLIHLVLQNMSRDQRKKELRDSIAKLKQQLLDKEEDGE